MSDAVSSLNTSGLAPKKQIQCWSDALSDLCGQFDIDPLEASSFEGRINYTTVSKLKLCQIEASQHRLAHTASRARPGSHPFVKILFQTYGISHFEQGGRRIELMPGDCLAYDVSCPHTIVSPTLTRHEVVIVPKELLQERGFRLAKLAACKLSARTLHFRGAFRVRRTSAACSGSISELSRQRFTKRSTLACPQTFLANSPSTSVRPSSLTEQESLTKKARSCVSPTLEVVARTPA